MRCLKIWLIVIVVFVTLTCVTTSKKLDLMRRSKARVIYSCRHSDICKNGGTCVRSRRHGRFRKCICPDGWTGRHCNVKYSCKHSNMCKSGRTCISYKRHGWLRKCICPNGCTGRPCNVPIPKQACINRRFCKNGGTLVCSGRSRRSCKCICTDGWSGRRCEEFFAKNHNEENKDFISVVLSDHQMQQMPSYIMMTTETSTNVNITTSETLPEEHLTKFNSSIKIPYPDFRMNGSSDVKAIRIRSTQNISVTVSVREDITTLIATEKLGTSYIISTPDNNFRFRVYAAITVTALHDNTSITFSDLVDTTFPDYTLNALETRIHEYHGSGEKTYRIQSSKPVAVFSGMYCMSDEICSNMVEQIPPYNQLDTVYIIPPNYNRHGTLARFLSLENTTATYPNNETKTIIAGRQYGYLRRNQTIVIRSTDPILMTSYPLEELNSGKHNPYWTVVPGVNQYLPRYKIIIPNGWNGNYIALMIRRSAVGGLRVNEQSIDANSIRFQENVFVEALEYSVIIAEVSEGELTLDTIDGTPFGLMVYGSRPGAGYGFAGNVILR